jgi:glycosyltransferase involved in cell wall biosynthesis
MVAIGASASRAISGVTLKKYALGRSDPAGSHPFARRFDLECQRGEQVMYALSSLLTSGFKPDVILAHPGWGETLPLRIMFPKARLLVYCEFFYGVEGQDVDFDPEFPKAGLDGHIGLKLKNATTLLALNDADFGVSPTEWQRSTFPVQYQSKIAVIHEGVDIDVVRPNPAASFKLASGTELRHGDEVVTYVVRSLEPLRGYHVFMRTLPRIMAERPNAQVVIVGGEGLSYGMPPPQGKTWKSVFLNEVEAEIDLRRLHFVGHLPYEDYLRLLQISSAHVYLTYPFVLSWSFLEAMGAGCVVIGSDTAPVREVVEDGSNGFLVPFFDVDAIADRVIEVLESPSKFLQMRNRARQYVVDHFDMERICIPKMIELMNTPATPTVVQPGISAIWPAKKRNAEPVYTEQKQPAAEDRPRRWRAVARTKPPAGGGKAGKSS